MSCWCKEIVWGYECIDCENKNTWKRIDRNTKLKLLALKELIDKEMDREKKVLLWNVLESEFSIWDIPEGATL